MGFGAEMGAGLLNKFIDTTADLATSAVNKQLDYNYWKKQTFINDQLANKNYEKQRDDAYEREDYLNANSKYIEQKAMRDAGLNPAWNDAGSSGISAASVGGASMNPISSAGGIGSHSAGSSMASNIQAYLNTEMQAAQIESLKVQNKKTSAETTQIENENKGVEEENEWTSKLMSNRIRFDNNSNTFYKETGEHDENGLPILDQINFRSYPKTAKGVQAMQSYTKFCDDSSTYQSHEQENHIKQIVGLLQIQDESILKALANTPAEAYRNVKANADSTELNTEIERIKKIVWSKVKGMDNEKLKVLSAILLSYAKL